MNFYNFTKLFLKDIKKDIIYCDSNNSESQNFCNDGQFNNVVSPPLCSYCKLLHFSVNVWLVNETGRGCLCFVRVSMSQNDCLWK